MYDYDWDDADVVPDTRLPVASSAPLVELISTRPVASCWVFAVTKEERRLQLADARSSFQKNAFVKYLMGLVYGDVLDAPTGVPLSVDGFYGGEAGLQRLERVPPDVFKKILLTMLPYWQQGYSFWEKRDVIGQEVEKMLADGGVSSVVTFWVFYSIITQFLEKYEDFFCAM